VQSCRPTCTVGIHDVYSRVAEETIFLSGARQLWLVFQRSLSLYFDRPQRLRVACVQEGRRTAKKHCRIHTKRRFRGAIRCRIQRPSDRMTFARWTRCRFSVGAVMIAVRRTQSAELSRPRRLIRSLSQISRRAVLPRVKHDACFRSQ